MIYKHLLIFRRITAKLTVKPRNNKSSDIKNLIVVKCIPVVFMEFLHVTPQIVLPFSSEVTLIAFDVCFFVHNFMVSKIRLLARFDI